MTLLKQLWFFQIDWVDFVNCVDFLHCDLIPSQRTYSITKLQVQTIALHSKKAERLNGLPSHCSSDRCNWLIILCVSKQVKNMFKIACSPNISEYFNLIRNKVKSIYRYMSVCIIWHMYFIYPSELAKINNTFQSQDSMSWGLWP